MIWLTLGLAGGAGAVVRVVISGWVSVRWAAPWGTVIANTVGTVALAVMVATDVSADVALVAGGGFLGGLTTFSTWMIDGVTRASSGDVPGALRHLAGVGVVAVGVAAAILALG